ncbi:hypothetical protein NNJEOMEG_00504 [Fundidesulfovibrio magnetotacticus]|uniref:TIR domain-containing protein n=1 Tax=Fundidesulfovibrio magnetotacticus TaxID=2730080 RepID=A0A6V8LQR3_9BACT|nr:toll/interleukin-1 receptor domain-containing protein [Fundidesulfovibrio magnetotacticus]GFK92678.1 hypothetical protein NNJEOMEG_00504 [Fundidesulfovibrio magnetotacticus]
MRMQSLVSMFVRFLLYALVALVVAYVAFARELRSGEFPALPLVAVGVVLAAALAAALTRSGKSRAGRKVFLIHHEADQERAAEIVVKLRQLGYVPWFAPEEIMPGQKVELSVMQGLEGCPVALLLVSQNLDLADPFLARQLEAALGKASRRDECLSPVIPALLDDTPAPEQLQAVQVADLRAEDGYERLDKGLKKILDNA